MVKLLIKRLWPFLMTDQLTKSSLTKCFSKMKAWMMPRSSWKEKTPFKLKQSSSKSSKAFLNGTWSQSWTSNSKQLRPNKLLLEFTLQPLTMLRELLSSWLIISQLIKKTWRYQKTVLPMWLFQINSILMMKAWTKLDWWVVKKKSGLIKLKFKSSRVSSIGRNLLVHLSNLTLHKLNKSQLESKPQIYLQRT